MSSELDLIMARLNNHRILVLDDSYRTYPSLVDKPLTYIIEYFRLNPGFIPCEYTIGNQTVVA